MTNKEKKIFSILALLYLIIEVQAFLFLSEIYTDKVSSESLSMYERFGYASSGIGLTIFVLFQLFKAANKPVKIVTTLAIPLIYVTLVWGVYEAVNQSPNIIPDNKRADAAYAALKTLDKPSWKNATEFFAPGDKSDLNELSKRVTKKHPTPNRTIRYIYINGLRGADRFTKRYNKQAEMFDKKLWEILWKDAKRKSIFDPEAKRRSGQIFDDWFYISSSFNMARHDPTKWLEALSTLYYMKEEGHPLYNVYLSLANEYIDDGYINLNDVPNHELEGISFQHYAWDKLKSKMPGFPEFKYEGDDFFERFRSSYSEYVLSPYIDAKGIKIPWYREGANDPTYNYAMRQLTPFLFDASGKAIVSFDNLQKKGVLYNYTSSLREALPKPLEDHWNNYYVRAIRELSTKDKSWDNKTNYDIHSDMLRIGAITPVLLIISGLLIVINVSSLFVSSRSKGAFAVALVVLMCISSERTGLDKKLLSTINKISVKESQIFLY